MKKSKKGNNNNNNNNNKCDKFGGKKMGQIWGSNYSTKHFLQFHITRQILKV